MYFVVFDDKCGRAVPDKRAYKDVVDRCIAWQSIDKQHATDIIGTEALLLSYKLAIKRNVIPQDSITFIYEEEVRTMRELQESLEVS